MISIETLDGDLVKVLNNVDQINFGFHKLFGFISDEKAHLREEVRKRQGFEYTSKDWFCQFGLSQKGKNLEFQNLESCTVEKKNSNTWELTTPLGGFKFSNTCQATIQDGLTQEYDSNAWMNKFTERVILAVFIIVPILSYLA